MDRSWNLIIFSTIPAVFASVCTPDAQNGAAKACPDGWTATKDPMFCLKYSRVRRSWEDAREQCQSEGADLSRAYFTNMINVIQVYTIPFLTIEQQQQKEPPPPPTTTTKKNKQIRYYNRVSFTHNVLCALLVAMINTCYALRFTDC
ncbi:hypothetical protein ElyMa_000332900 [Elysia marginata]|uniref:C-type lectin domain-containing protein n=1 Tax=Elysia marginata TaxID=1093978 RepID=A0AAV4FBH8_9GAST|nr:hypothetical protein ElyMa_000332900 [Elysia marginata]